MTDPRPNLDSNRQPSIRQWLRALPCLAALLLCVFALGISLSAQESAAAQPVADAGQWHRLNAVVAVVNQQVLLASDVDEEMRLVHLLPGGGTEDNSAAGALERLITRLLIEQQIRIEDPSQLNPDPQEVQKSLVELRQDLPGCKITDCMTDAGWRSFLAGLNLTPDQVAAYWKDRYAVLGFIGQRFRSGISVRPEEIASYYNKTLVPLYRNRAEAPTLPSVSARIEEILLQQRVNAMLDDWVQSLREQGKIEIVDASLRDAVEQMDARSKAETQTTPQKRGDAAP